MFSLTKAPSKIRIISLYSSLQSLLCKEALWSNCPPSLSFFCSLLSLPSCLFPSIGCSLHPPPPFSLPVKLSIYSPHPLFPLVLLGLPNWFIKSWFMHWVWLLFNNYHKTRRQHFLFLSLFYFFLLFDLQPATGKKKKLADEFFNVKVDDKLCVFVAISECGHTLAL